VCVGADAPPADDAAAPFTIVTCDACGLITLLDYVEPEVLYKSFHNDAQGATWTAHYAAFAALIAANYTLGAAGRIVEVGAGQGKLLSILKPLCGGVMEVIDPQYEGERGGVTVHATLLDSASAATLEGTFDAMVSSHTLEHFPEFNAYFLAARRVLKPGGLLFTSVPNQEFGFAKAHGSMLSFEHPSVCTNLHWMALFYRNGFLVQEVRLFRTHSLMVVARRVEEFSRLYAAVADLIERHRINARASVPVFEAALGVKLTNARYMRLACTETHSATRDFRALTEADLLKATGHKRGRVYGASAQVLALRAATRSSPSAQARR